MLRRLVLAGLAGVIATPATLAQNTVDYPSRPIKLVVPFPPGGTSDLMGRLMAEELARQLRQPVVVDNRAGAGGAIGADQVAKAPPDGHTLLLSGIGSNAIIHGFQSPRPGYTEADFVHISQLAAGPNVLVVRHDFPARSFKELVAWVKAHPGKFSYGQVPASSGHLTTEYLKQTAGLFMVGIPYKGGAPALNDVLAGQIEGMFINQDAALPHVRAGKLRALAVTSPQRNPLYPDVPTVAEAGYPGFAAVSWTGLSAPAGTPAAIVERLQTALARGFAAPEARNRLEALGFVVVTSTPAEYGRFVRSEGERWARVIRSGGLKPD
ncbi:Bug family tripartite tricarboxylate transporter substrate binding protein [Pseudaquabacterium rugosum]|uniref:Tripartite tricarboxylate transporter substrate binding protein n=1 Tax=Pseudaquabacterium rugosum TaxID=2984194 RepID=A0ABU9BER5_9BURK